MYVIRLYCIPCLKRQIFKIVVLNWDRAVKAAPSSYMQTFEFCALCKSQNEYAVEARASGSLSRATLIVGAHIAVM